MLWLGGVAETKKTQSKTIPPNAHLEKGTWALTTEVNPEHTVPGVGTVPPTPGGDQGHRADHSQKESVCRPRAKEYAFAFGRDTTTLMILSPLSGAPVAASHSSLATGPRVGTPSSVPLGEGRRSQSRCSFCLQGMLSDSHPQHPGRLLKPPPGSHTPFPRTACKYRGILHWLRNDFPRWHSTLAAVAF